MSSIIEIFNKSLDILEERGQQYDQNKERSLPKVTSLFNTLTGKELTVEEAHMFLILLKLVRQQTHPKEDNIIDAINYLALMSEFTENK